MQSESQSVYDPVLYVLHDAHYARKCTCSLRVNCAYAMWLNTGRGLEDAAAETTVERPIESPDRYYRPPYAPITACGTSDDWIERAHWDQVEREQNGQHEQDTV